MDNILKFSVSVSGFLKNEKLTSTKFNSDKCGWMEVLFSSDSGNNESKIQNTNIFYFPPIWILR